MENSSDTRSLYHLEKDWLPLKEILSERELENIAVFQMYAKDSTAMNYAIAVRGDIIAEKIENFGAVKLVQPNGVFGDVRNGNHIFGDKGVTAGL